MTDDNNGYQIGRRARERGRARVDRSPRFPSAGRDLRHPPCLIPSPRSRRRAAAAAVATPPRSPAARRRTRRARARACGVAALARAICRASLNRRAGPRALVPRIFGALRYCKLRGIALARSLTGEAPADRISLVVLYDYTDS